MTTTWQLARGWAMVLAVASAFALVGCKGDRESTDRTDRVAERAADRTDRAGDKLNQAWVTAKIQAKFFADQAIKGRDIDVDTRSGVVTLSGVVEGEQARQRAVQIARETDGVTRVEDRLTVIHAAVATSGSGRPAPAGTPPPASAGQAISAHAAGSDPDILTRIQSQFFTREPIRHSGLGVFASGGVVTLTGEVDSESLHQEALSIATATPGVQRVEDRVQLSAAATPAGTSGEITPVPPAPVQPPPAPPALEPPAGTDQDEWIATQILARYFQDVLVKDTSITVSSSGGTVTLQGSVPNEAARQQAVRIAKEIGGVAQVDDRITVGR